MTLFAFSRRSSAVLYRYLCATSGDGYWILPANICPIVPAVFQKANKQYKLLDINSTTLCLDEKSVLHAIKTEPCLGVLWARAYGSDQSAEYIFQKIKNSNSSVNIIDDKCLCPPAFKHSGGVADLELFSSGYSKFVDLGWGGWGYFRADASLAPHNPNYCEPSYKNLVALFKQCIEKKTPFACPHSHWLDLREPEIAWETFRTHVQNKYDAITAHRNTLREIYAARLSKWALPSHLQNWRFNILTDRQQELIAAIFSNGHFASTHYQSLVPSFGTGHTPVANNIGNRIVNLFIDQYYTVPRATELAILVERFLNSKS